MIGAGAEAKGNPQYVVVGRVGDRGDSRVDGSHLSWLKMPVKPVVRQLAS